MIRFQWLGAVVLAVAGLAQAQPYPSQPVKLIVPWPPGGGVDTSARIISVPLGQRLGQTVVIENRPGAGGNIGTELAARAKIERIAHVAFRTARERRKKVCSVDKANVLETMQLWRETVAKVGKGYPDIELTHLFVDAAAMQLYRAPKQFDVIVT